MSNTTKALRQIEELLKEGPEEAGDRQRTAFGRLAAPFGEREMVLFGAGELGRMTLAGLRRLNIQPLAFADNNSALWGREVEGVAVLSPDEAARRYAGSVVFLVTVFTGSIPAGQLLKLGCKKVVSFVHLFATYPQVYLPYLYLDKPDKIFKQAEDVLKAAAQWADEKSLQEYVAQLRYSLFLDFEYPYPPLEQSLREKAYFDYDVYRPLDDEVMVDVGAYDGDSIRIFLRERGSRFNKIVALEPDPDNFRALQQYVATLPDEVRSQIDSFPYACGRRREKVRFHISGDDSRVIDAGGVEVQSMPLDEVAGQYSPTLLKLDVEGVEIETLEGAAKLIEANQPVLAVCAYHRQDDLWRIPLFIRSHWGKYRLYMRSYVERSWDSLICYAVPENRLI